MIDQWRVWIAAFDACVDDNDWDRLIPFLTEDVVYTVHGAPFACEVRGRDAVIAAFAKSIAGFDRKFSERRWLGVGIRDWATGAVSGRATGWYRLDEHPPISFSAHSQWIFRDGQISVMTDIYDVSEADSQATLTALATMGDGFDPSYV
jgi:SnoaL-like domain